MAEVLDALIVATPAPPGASYAYTSTLASHTGVILDLIEQRFGPRDRAYTLLGIEFCETGPQCWFPFGRRDVVIQLSLSAMTHPIQAFYQLGHECVHLLDPGLLGNASVFEEGVATLVGLEYARRFMPEYPLMASKYATAATLADRALGINPDVVRAFRTDGRRFSAIEPAQLVGSCPGLPADVAATLCMSFQAWDGVAPPLPDALAGPIAVAQS